MNHLSRLPSSKLFFLVTLAVCLFPAAVPGNEREPPGTTHALLINGGMRPESNYLSHLHHIEDMVGLLRERGLPAERIHVFSADGRESEPDVAVRDVLPERFWLIDGTYLDKLLRPRVTLENTTFNAVHLEPARKSVLEQWFRKSPERLAPGDRLLLFVTDHGTRNNEDPDNGAISMWQEKMTVEDLREMLRLLPPRVQLVMLMSQCFSGTFANAIYDDDAVLSAGKCGFFSTTRDLPAYGCYPEGRDRDRLGHAFRFIEALDRHSTIEDAHMEVLVTDSTPDVPLRTSDLYLEQVVREEAKARGESLNKVVDELLEQAWRDRAAWEPEIRLLDKLGNTYGTFSPRSLVELEEYESELPALIKQMKTYATRWEQALVSIKNENLNRFEEQNPEWREALQPEALESRDLEGRAELLADLLPGLELNAMDDPELWARLERVRELGSKASEARWRLEVRRGALRRMRAILIGVAGRVLISSPSVEEEAATLRTQQQSLDALVGCEALEPGTLPASQTRSTDPVVASFPPLAQELKLLDEVLPSWLGVRFGAVPENIYEGRDLPDGATRLLAVYPDSPALEAGLEAGDIVLGPPEKAFTAAGQLREWTMTSPPGMNLSLMVRRPGNIVEEDLDFEVALSLRPFPMVWPKLPGPPQVGSVAPQLPIGIEPVGRTRLPELEGTPHVLFFWATWCVPCKKAVPEVLAFAKENNLRAIAISDEDELKVAGFLKDRKERFFEHVAVDTLRKSFISFGVSGTPTIIVVDEEGVVSHRQVGYNPTDGLKFDDWNWPADD